MLKSPIRYVGGKSWLAERLVQEIHDAKPTRYIEPFLGGGSIAINVRPTIPKYLGDTNATVMDMWRCLRTAPGALMRELIDVEGKYPNTQAGYLDARAELNHGINNPRPIWIRRAALFLYINARSFNGIWRTNQSGYYNVPYGKIAKPSSIDADEAMALSNAIFNANLITGGFAQTIEHVRDLRGAAVYADPPYDGTYDGYSGDGFSDELQEQLANTLEFCVKSGARVWATNSDTEKVRRWYHWAEVTEIEEQHNVGATGDRRGKRKCLLIRG